MRRRRHNKLPCLALPWPCLGGGPILVRAWSRDNEVLALRMCYSSLRMCYSSLRFQAPAVSSVGRQRERTPRDSHATRDDDEKSALLTYLLTKKDLTVRRKERAARKKILRGRESYSTLTLTHLGCLPMYSQYLIHVLVGPASPSALALGPSALLAHVRRPPVQANWKSPGRLTRGRCCPCD